MAARLRALPGQPKRCCRTAACGDYWNNGMSMRWIVRLRGVVTTALFAAAAAHAQYAGQTGTSLIHVTGYVIHATVSPTDQMLTAQAQVTFTPAADLPTASFVLHDALHITKVVDANGNAVNGQRGPYDTLLLTPATPLVKGQSYTWTFSYAGKLDGSQGGPVPGLTLAKI